MTKRNIGRTIHDTRIVDNDAGTNETIAQIAIRTGLAPFEIIRLNRLGWALVVRHDFAVDNDDNAAVPSMPLTVAATVVFDEWLDSPQDIDLVKAPVHGYAMD